MKGELTATILISIIFSSLILSPSLALYSQPKIKQTFDWTHYARIAGGFEDNDLWEYDGKDRDPLTMTSEEWDAAMKTMADQGVNTVDLDLGLYYYETFKDPSETIATIQKAVQAAHKYGIKIFTYQAGLEMQTENANQKTDTVYKTHPDWIQRGPNGEYAIYNSSFAFWIAPGDEDVWITPLNLEWRQLYMKLAKQIAETGIDGFYVDVPYFIDWSFEWGSFDSYMKNEFTKRTGYQPPTPQQFSEEYSNFRAWVKFRSDIITEFLADIKSNITSVKPDIKLIVEIYGGYGQYGVRYGTEIEKITNVVDVITHEFGLYGNEGASNYYTEDNWLFHSSILQILKGIDNNHATWMLQYAEGFQDSIMLGSVSIGLGTNFWETKYPEMLRSASIQARTTLFTFIQQSQGLLYGSWEPVNPVLIYYSGTTKEVAEAIEQPILPQSNWDQATGEDYPNYFGGMHVQDVIGIVMMLLANHIPVKIITKETLPNYVEKSTSLIMPSVRALSDEEVKTFTEFVNNGGQILLSGKNGVLDENGDNRTNNALSNIKTITISAEALGKQYLIALMQGNSASIYEQTLFSSLENANYKSPIKTNISKHTLLLPMENPEGQKIVRIINFDGVQKEKQLPITKQVGFEFEGEIYECNVSYISILNINTGECVKFNVTIPAISSITNLQEDKEVFLSLNLYWILVIPFLILIVENKLTYRKRK